MKVCRYMVIQKTVRMFILAGQSNMAGRANAGWLDEQYRKENHRALYHYLCGFKLDKAEPFHSDTLTYLAPCHKHLSTPGPHFGPEISFADRILEGIGDDLILIVKVALGGTSLRYDWNPDTRSGPQLFQALVDTVRKAGSELSHRAMDCHCEGFFWMQGESDALKEEDAVLYYHNLVSFISRMRGSLGNSDLPFIIGRIMNRREEFSPAVRLVQIAQELAAENSSLTWIISTDDLPDIGDSLHYNEKGIWELGRRFADRYLSVIDR